MNARAAYRFGVNIMKKNASKMKMKDDCCCSMPCDMPIAHPYGRGKALFAIAVGLMLITFGFNYISIQMLALVIGVLFALKGTMRLLGSW